MGKECNSLKKLENANLGSKKQEKSPMFPFAYYSFFLVKTLKHSVIWKEMKIIALSHIYHTEAA